MANFIENDAVREEIANTAATAKKLHLSANSLVAGGAGPEFEDGDKLVIPAQVAKVIALTGRILETAKANKRAEGYYAFDAIIKRGKKEIPCSVSLRQLYQPTVWMTAESLSGVTDADGNDVEAFTAPFREGKKRWGENGTVQAYDGVPYIAKDINVDVTLTDVVFVPLYLDEETRKGVLEDKYTALVKRENYAVAL